jgi:hypothetical protein
MKIIFSRKGFDSGSGGVASPIFPSGELHPLPIPESLPGPHSKRYQDIQAGGLSSGPLVADLTEGRIKSDQLAHLDPDLNPLSLPRSAHWRPVFGQAGAAEKHLQNQGVKGGDVFVFYGWFRAVERVAGRYRYVRHAPDLHVIFGWLQVEQRLSVDIPHQIPDWAQEHPHCKAVKYAALDCIYLSTNRLHLPGTETLRPGAGVFPRFAPELCLTAAGHSRSIWRLPAWLYPRSSCLSYHSDRSRWTREEDTVLLRTVGRGQEFVLDCQEYPEALAWLYHLLDLSESDRQTQALPPRIERSLQRG